MKPSTFMNLKNLGYGNDDKEMLWDYCDQMERLKILRKLQVARFDIRAECFYNVNDTHLQEWSKLQYHKLPEELQPFLFFGLSGNNFNSEHVHKQIACFG